MNGTNSVRLESLKKDNYDTWKLQVQALLIKNDAWKYVSGDKIKPQVVVGDNATVQAANNWTEADLKARSDLILAISPSELKQIKGCTTSREIWLKLETIYQSKGPARKATLLKQLTLQKMREEDDVREHVTKFFNAVDKLEEMDIDINKELLAILLLYSLPPNFENFRCAIESRDELPSPEALKIKIFEEYDARKEKSKEAVPNAMIAKRNFKKFTKRESSKDENNTEKDESKGKFPFRCNRCKNRGHKSSECYTNLDKKKQTSRKVEEVGYLVTEEPTTTAAAFKVEKDFKSSKWCLDSGCTSHMCHNEEKFEKLEESGCPLLNLASSASTAVRGKGTVKLLVSTDEDKKLAVLENTLNVPDLRTDLISVGKITDKGYNVTFKKENAIITDQQKNIKMIADRGTDGLYYIRQSEEEFAKATMESEKSKLTIWHQRFGHLNEKSLKEMIKNETVLGVDLKKEEKLPPCTTCLSGKLTRIPFTKSSNRVTEPLEIIHSDVCGPMRTESLSGAKYFITFIDDSTRWCEIKFITKKSEVLTKFKEFQARFENLLDKKIKFLQSDNGGEYCNREFDEHLKRCGIERRLTIPHTPEQNGVAERKNRTIVEMARCMLIDSKLPSSFWAEAVATANHVRNRCPSQCLDGKTPYELLFGDRPIVSYFQIFGSKVYVLDKVPNKGKFEPRSHEGTFIGYSNQSKAYRVWIPSERKIVATRDLKFLNEFKTEGKFEEFFDEESREQQSAKDNRVVEIDLQPICNEDHAEDAENADHQFYESESSDDEEDGAEDGENEADILHEDGDVIAAPLQQRRGPGRPRIIRDGRRGRPKKQYHYVDALDHIPDEQAGLAEIPLKQALSSPEIEEWKAAIQSEFESLIKKDTWKLVERPKDRSVVGCRLILRNKHNPDGTLERRKARLVAKGFTQRFGIDFHDTFAPVARLSSVRTVMALAAQHDLKIHQLDVTTAYLNGKVDEEIYMEMPELLEDMLERIIKKSEKNSLVSTKARAMIQDFQRGGKVCLIQKSLYGLKQSGRQWHLKLDEKLRRSGLKPSNADPCIYWIKRGEVLMLVTIYVDDILIACRETNWILQLKKDLMQDFEMKDLGTAHYFLGIELTQNNGEIKMSQKGYIEDVLQRFGMENSKPVTTPFDPSIKLKKHDTNQETCEEKTEKVPYRELIGSLMYLAVATRPDIAFAVSSLSQFNDCYNTEHWTAAKRVLRYLRGTNDQGIIFKKDNQSLRGFVDADWGACLIDRRSYTGYAFILGGAAISWEARKQRTVALSTTEAEYMGLTEATKEAIYLINFLNELGLQKMTKVSLYNDNQGALKLAENPVFHSRTKHIDIRHHFVRKALKDYRIKTEYVSTDNMPADILTKGLPREKHQKCCHQLGLRKIG